MSSNKHLGYYYKSQDNGFFWGKVGVIRMEHSEGLLGRMAMFYPIGDYKAACVIVLHQAIHLFFTDVLFCNKTFSFNSRLQGHPNISTPNKGLVFFSFSSLMQ